MFTMHFSTFIHARPERVWQTLWNDHTCRQWTAVFHEGSYAEFGWQEGSKVLLLSPGGEGMVSRIARLIPNDYVFNAADNLTPSPAPSQSGS